MREQRLSGAPIFDHTERHYFAYVTDTLPEVLKHEPWLKSVQELMLECTFLDERKSVKLARKGGHIHLDELLPHFELLENQRIHLMHFSQLYTPKEIRQILSARCNALTLQKLRPLLPCCDTDWWH